MELETEIDDILGNLTKKSKKRINSSRKGKRAERDLCEVLKNRFKKPFARKPEDFGSGAWSTNNEEIQDGLDLDSMAGDILTPKGFKFTIESKMGYDLEALNWFRGATKQADLKKLHSFFEQAKKDADRVGKQPIVIYRKDRCPPIVFLEKQVLDPIHWGIEQAIYLKDWRGVALIDLLGLDEEFFFA